MSFRTIRKVYKAQKVNMGGIILDQALPLRGLDQIDPILLIHHWADNMKGGKRPQDVGVGPHPHRGFSPVTFIFKGGVHHRDSLGHDEVVMAGGTQWMNSGSGLVHSERPPTELAKSGGEFEIIQFWVNSPASQKMKTPSYQPLKAEATPVVQSNDEKIEVGVVNGTFQGVDGPISADSPLLILRMEAKAEGKMDFTIPEGYNCLLYVLNGEMRVNDDQTVSTKEMADFNPDGSGFTVMATQNSRAIVLAGQPLNEPVSTYGPFVMNTQPEIIQALNDYQAGKMGQLVEQFD